MSGKKFNTILNTKGIPYSYINRRDESWSLGGGIGFEYPIIE